MKVKILGAEISIPYAFLLLIAALVCFFQFSLYLNSFQFDIHNVMLPWRHFAGENLQNGLLPLWNPYQQLGYPLCDDLQYAGWNAEVWIVGNLFGYSYKTFYVLVFFYVWMAGVGMFRLANFFANNRDIAFFISLSFMLSGCMISHLQQFNVVMGMVWLPFILWQFFEFLKNYEWKNVLGFALFSYLQITGYPAFYFMLLYFFIVVGVYHLLMYRKTGTTAVFKKMAVRGVAMVVLTAAMILPVIVAVKQSAPFVERIRSGVTSEEALSGPFSPQSLLSLLLPVVAVKNQSWLSTDFTAANLFFGAIPLAIFIFSLFKKQTGLQKIILLFSLFFLIASFGDYTPLRKLLFDYVPLMNLFREPAIFRIPALLLILIHISVFLRDEEFSWQKLSLLVWISAMVYLFAAIIISVFNKDLFQFAGKKWEEAIRSADAGSSLLLQSVVLMVISLLTFLAVRFSKINDWRKVAFFSFLSLFAGVQFNIYINAAAPVDPLYLSDWMKTLPVGFPLPAQDPLRENLQFINRNSNLAMNRGNFDKMLLPDEFTSYRFDKFRHVTDVQPVLNSLLSGNPIAYFSDRVVGTSDGVSGNSKVQRVTFSDSTGLKKLSLYGCSNRRIKCKRFLPSEFLFDVQCDGPVIFNLQQSWFPGWQIYVDGKKAKHFLNADLLMSIVLEKGPHEISFKFGNRAFELALLISLTVFFLSLALFVALSAGRVKLFWAGMILAVAGSATVLFLTRKGRSEIYYASAGKIAAVIKKYDDNGIFVTRHFPDDAVTFIHPKSIYNLKNAFMKIRGSGAQNFFMAWYGELPDARLMEYIREFFPGMKFIYGNARSFCGAVVFDRNLPRSGFLKVYEWNNDADSTFFRFTLSSIEKTGNEKMAIVKLFHPYSPSFSADYLTLTGNKRLPVRVSFDFACDTLNESIVFLTMRDTLDKTVWDRSFSLQPYMLNPREWNRFVMKELPDIEVAHGCHLDIFLMNTSGRFVLMKNFRVETLEK